MPNLSTLLTSNHTAGLFSSATISYMLIAVAEIGDKSQLVCMALAARHRHMPVLLGAIVAFIILNTLAVVFGAAMAHWLPTSLISAVVALLFFVFGIQSLRDAGVEDDDTDVTLSSKSLFLTTLMMIMFAEFGDKTQLAVVALSSVNPPIAVWLGATLALATTNALGVWAGRTVLQRIPMRLLHRISGVFFILLALLAAYRAVSSI